MAQNKAYFHKRLIGWVVRGNYSGLYESTITSWEN